MALKSSDIDVKLGEISNILTGIRGQGASVKASTNKASSRLGQLRTDYKELIKEVKLLEGSDNIVDKLQVARLGKLIQEGTELGVKINLVKVAVDSL